MFPFILLFAIVFAGAVGPSLVLVWFLLAFISFAIVGVHEWNKEYIPADINEPLYVVPLGHTKPVIFDHCDLYRYIRSYIRGNPNGYIHISQWDISRVTHMRYMFSHLINTKRDNDAIAGIEDWDMSHVTDVESMFTYCHCFNRPIGKWNLAKVNNVSGMMCSCDAFNQDLEEWTTTLGKDVETVDINQHPFVYSNKYWKKHNWVDAIAKKNQEHRIALFNKKYATPEATN